MMVFKPTIDKQIFQEHLHVVSIKEPVESLGAIDEKPVFFEIEINGHSA